MRSSSLLLLLALLACPPTQVVALPPDAIRAMESGQVLRCSPVLHLSFSADGTLIQALGKASGLRRWKVADGKSEGPVAPHVGMTCGFLSRDGNLSLLAQGQSVRLIRSTQELPQVNFDTSNSVNAVSLSPDGKVLALGGDDHAVEIRDAQTGERLHSCRGHDAYVSAVAFDPAVRLLASGAHDRTIRLWDVRTGKQVRELLGHTDQVASLVFLPDGKTLASASRDRTARLWDVKTGKELRRLEGHGLSLTAVHASEDGKTLATGSLDGTARVWDVRTGKLLRTIEVARDGVQAVALSRDGKVLATGDDEDGVSLWNETGVRIHRCEGAGPSGGNTERGVHCVRLSPDHKWIAAGRADSTVRLYEAATGKEVRILGRQHDNVWSVAFSPDGRHVASVGRRDGTVHVWDRDRGGEVRRFTGQKGGISRVLYGRDGKRLIAAGGSFDPSIYVWDVEAGKALHRLTGHKDYIDGIALSPDEKTLASTARAGAVRLWDLTTGKETRQLSAPDGNCVCVAFSPDGTTLAGGGQGIVWLWDLATGKVRQRLETPGAFHHVSFLRDGRTLVVGGFGFFSLWDLLTGRERRRTSVASVMSLAVDPGGRRVVSGAHDGAILLWDPTGLKGEDRKPVRLDAEELDRRWQHLTMSPEQAHEAVWKFTVAPQQAAALFEKHLKPVEGVAREQIEQWVNDLDSPRFRVRDRAATQLEAVGDLAEDALKRGLGRAATLETRRRIERLLDALANQSLAPEVLRQFRMVEALEHMGTPEARRLLERMAAGFPEARLTREAKAALRRLSESIP
jgi:WD40 repeat protein